MSQKLSIGSFGSKFNFLPPVGAPTRFYDISATWHRSVLSARNVRRCFGAEVCIDFGVDYAKFDESRYAERYELAQRSFFGPSGSKSDAADPFLILPRFNFELFVR